MILYGFYRKTKFPQESIFEDFSRKNIRFSQSEALDIEKEEDIKNVFKIINNSQDPRVQKIFKMRYQDGKKLTPWKKIAKKLDLSIQGCINIHNKHLTEIKKYV